MRKNKKRRTRDGVWGRAVSMTTISSYLTLLIAHHPSLPYLDNSTNWRIGVVNVLVFPLEMIRDKIERQQNPKQRGRKKGCKRGTVKDINGVLISLGDLQEEDEMLQVKERLVLELSLRGVWVLCAPFTTVSSHPHLLSPPSPLTTFSSHHHLPHHLSPPSPLTTISSPPSPLTTISLTFTAGCPVLFVCRCWSMSGVLAQQDVHTPEL